MTHVVDLIFWLGAKLPDFCVHLGGRLLGWFLRVILRFRRTVVVNQMTTAFPEKSAAERQALLRLFYRHLGLLILEMLRIPGSSVATIRATNQIHGLEHLHAALEKKKGVLLLAGHLGNWEIGLATAVANGLNLHTIVKEIKGAAGQYAVTKLRAAHGVKLIPRHNSIFQILRALRENAIIGFVLDQNMTADEGVFVNFFGRPACTMPGLAVIAQRQGTPVLPVFFHRDPNLTLHHAIIGAPIPWEEVPGDAAASIRHNTQRYTTILENGIRLHPEQWLWIHKRWKTVPPPAPTPPPHTTNTPQGSTPP